MLVYKGFELKEENINDDGVEILVSVENKSNMSDEDFEILLWQCINFSENLYVDYQYDNYFEIRGKEFTFDKNGVDALRFSWNVLSRRLKDMVVVNIGVYVGKFVFEDENGNKKFNQEDVTIDEFERNIEYR